MAGTNSDDSRSKPESPPWLSIIIALIALAGSLGGSWILAGAKFEKELEAKNTEISDLTQRMTEFKKQMDAATDLPDKVNSLQNEVGRLQGSVNNLSRVTSGLEESVGALSRASSREEERGFGTASSGTKACKIRVDGHWIDTIALPKNATAHHSARSWLRRKEMALDLHIIV
jgi:hypothetical protein